MRPISPFGRAFGLVIVIVCLSLIVELFITYSTVGDRDFTSTTNSTLRPTSTPTPSPSPTPIWPLTASCRRDVPTEACVHLRNAVDQDPDHFVWSADPAPADVRLSTEEPPDADPVGTWIYVLVAPFFTVEDGVSSDDLKTTWAGEPAGPFVEHPMLVTTDTWRALGIWGPSAGEAVHTVGASELLTEAIRRDGWALVPFDQLEPHWKVLRVDGSSPLDRNLDHDAYPLSLPLYLDTDSYSDVLSLLPSGFTNRDPEKMTVLLMTGVTALTRGTAAAMERRDVTYPARDIHDWLIEPDITHMSNEVAFAENCPPPTGRPTMVFCSDPRYFKLLEHTDVDVVELTGNHLLDWGVEAMENSLTMYDEHDISTFGGGGNLTQARQPATLTHGVHTFGFLGCNPVGPASVWATDDRPGAAPCDYDRLAAQIRQLRERDVIPIVTLQHWELDRYIPTSRQRADFRAMAEAGAAIVSGSQAHQPQGFDFHADALIHYGLGNLFFDQMQRLEYRQEFLDRHVFYDGRHISTELLTAMLEDHARPRPMTLGERRALLEAAFAASKW